MKRLSLALLPLLAACSSMPRPSMPSFSSWLTPYKIDVRQGNFISQDMAAQLKPGMTKDQVRFALGTPLLQDIFHADRWDYVYRFQPGKGQVEERRLAVFFDNGKLVRVAGDVTAAAAGDTTNLPAPPGGRVIDIQAPGSNQAAEAKAADAKGADKPAEAKPAADTGAKP